MFVNWGKMDWWKQSHLSAFSDFLGGYQLIGVAFPDGSVGDSLCGAFDVPREGGRTFFPAAATISLGDGRKVAQTQSDQGAIDRIFVTFFKATAVIWSNVEEAAHCAVGTPVSRSIRTPQSAAVSCTNRYHWPHLTNSLETFQIEHSTTPINSTQLHLIQFNTLSFNLNFIYKFKSSW
jgi:hypothetical protein